MQFHLIIITTYSRCFHPNPSLSYVLLRDYFKPCNLHHFSIATSGITPAHWISILLISILDAEMSPAYSEHHLIDLVSRHLLSTSLRQ